MAGPDEREMRASDAEREEVAERLRLALNEGRLGIAEFDERVGRAYAAVTRGDLEQLTRDLPAERGSARPSRGPVAEPEEGEPAERGRGGARSRAAEWRDWAGTSFVLVGIWLITSITSGEPQFFWPIFPMGIWAVILLGMTIFGSGDGGGSGGRR
ncbi:DUF1707 domain-containing protein [Actinopolyspora erythraea]|uniref:DUF1707 domain-containing protein n=1 Tax=Actinopolyspora erythraea TaxID=414996 RepID=A0A099D9Z1_9ACTN|nr:DUF1707 domain-containing protein [Actinopolyspora erythraea]ASU80594.1 DUF1707 domain-containing protein [Actinopolyspora erythraea]KGI82726.1 hypothetical protein IL38_02250 [Actinopolyspora erythraea]